MTAEIVDAFDRFTSAVAHTGSNRRAAKYGADCEWRRLHTLKSARDGDRQVSMEQFFFTSASSGEPVFYAFKGATVDEEIEALVARANRELHWYFVEVYEAFEEFVRQAAICGGFPERRKVFGILAEFKFRYPRIATVERENRLRVDLGCVVALASQMRNQIVHERGVVGNKGAFIDRVLSEAKPLFRSDTTRLQRTSVEEHLLLRKDGTIWLMDIPGKPPGAYHSQFDSWCDLLLAYAHLIAVTLEPPLVSRKISRVLTGSVSGAGGSGGRA